MLLIVDNMLSCGNVVGSGINYKRISGSENVQLSSTDIAQPPVLKHFIQRKKLVNLCNVESCYTVKNSYFKIPGNLSNSYKQLQVG